MISFTNLHLACQFASFEFITRCETMAVCNLSKEIILIPMETVMIIYFHKPVDYDLNEMTVYVAMTDAMLP